MIGLRFPEKSSISRHWGRNVGALNFAPPSPESSRSRRAAHPPGATGDFYLRKLAELGTGLAQSTPGSAEFFAAALRIVQEAMEFTLSVIYRVETRVERTLVVEVAGVLDPAGARPALGCGARLAIDLDGPDPIFANEAQAYLRRGVAALNVPGEGCDIASYVAAGAGSEAYLLAGDFVGAEAGLQPVDVGLFEIATGLLSALLTKAHFQHRADHDRLTGLMSAARIRTEFDDCWQRRVLRGGSGLAVILVDIDHFKLINDHHGHPAGDTVLQDLGRLMATTLRPGRDRAGRYGGEEFLLLLEETEPDEACALMERLRREVERHAFHATAVDGHAGAAVSVTVSVGACMLGPDEPLPAAAAMLAMADRALYAAKRAGRNRVVTFSPGEPGAANP